jgi:O-methyltransferase
MKLLKQALQRFLAARGYELSRIERERVVFANFENLAKGLEGLLSERGPAIPPNNQRTRLLARLLGTPPSQAYFIVQALARSREVPGDVCEFGVAQGETSTLIANEIQDLAAKTLHLFDSFEGLPAPTAEDRLIDDVLCLGTIEAYKGTMAYPEEMARARLRSISFPEDRIKVHKGFFPDSLVRGAGLPTSVSFAYVDLDFYDSILCALEFLHTRTSSGSIVIVDDYGFFSTGCKKAVDDFLRTKHAYVVEVPEERYGFCAVLTRK